jgi:hypothetical protein
MSNNTRVAFHRLWMDEISHYDEVVSNPNMEDILKSFARRVYEYSSSIYTQGYNDGYKQGETDSACDC